MTTKDELKDFVDRHLDKAHEGSEGSKKEWKQSFGQAIDTLDDEEVEGAGKKLEVMGQLADLIEDFTTAASAEDKSKVIARLKALHDEHQEKQEKSGLGLIGSYVWKHASHLFDTIMLGRTPDEFEQTVKRLLERE